MKTDNVPPRRQSSGKVVSFAPTELVHLDLKKISMTRLGQMIWENGIAEGESRGKVTGKAEGRISAYLEMLRDGFITEAEVAHRLNMTQEELNILLNKVSV